MILSENLKNVYGFSNKMKEKLGKIAIIERIVSIALSLKYVSTVWAQNLSKYHFCILCIFTLWVKQINLIKSVSLKHTTCNYEWFRLNKKKMVNAYTNIVHQKIYKSSFTNWWKHIHSLRYIQIFEFLKVKFTIYIVYNLNYSL